MGPYKCVTVGNHSQSTSRPLSCKTPTSTVKTISMTDTWCVFRADGCSGGMPGQSHSRNECELQGMRLALLTPLVLPNVFLGRFT